MIHNHASLAAAQAYGADPADRVRRFVPLVRKLAWHFSASVDDVMDTDDLIQIGMIALVEAAGRHDRPGEDGFAAYAKMRVRGAMVDAIRTARKGSRRRRALARQVDDARRALQQQTGRVPSRAEIAAHAGIDAARIAELENAVEASFTPLDEAMADSIAALPDDEPDALARIIEREDGAALAQAIAALPERLQLVIQLYFVEELNLGEIAEVLGVSIPRVHQLKAAALAQLRSALQE